MGLPANAGNAPRRLLPPPSAKYERAERGWLAYWQLAPNAYATCANGHLRREMSKLIMQHGERLYDGGRVVYGFHDWLEMTHYESACRIDLTNWVLAHRKYTVLHIAVASPVIAMGVSVANMVLGSLIHIHKSAGALEQAYIAAFPTR
jgi:hypothetical protein